jgi:hypothetical protein
MSEPTRNEKDEKQEKGNGESWDEKWRRDPVEAAVWALVLIWAGLVWLAQSIGLWSNLFGEGIQAWTIGFIGAGLIVLLGVVFRMVVPGYRRPVLGNTIFGLVLLGIGLAQIIDQWVAVGAVVLIVIGVAILLRGFVSRE